MDHDSNSSGHTQETIPLKNLCFFVIDAKKAPIQTRSWPRDKLWADLYCVCAEIDHPRAINGLPVALKQG